MLQLNFTTEEWKRTPELATTLYAAFPWRDKQDLREFVVPQDITLVARHYGHLAGFAMIAAPPYYCHYTFFPQIPLLRWLVVTKCFRRWRVGTAIVNMVYDAFGPHCLRVYNANETALYFYYKNGYDFLTYDPEVSGYSWYIRR